MRLSKETTRVILCTCISTVVLLSACQYSSAQRVNIDFKVGQSISFASSVKTIHADDKFSIRKGTTLWNEMAQWPTLGLGLGISCLLNKTFAVSGAINVVNTDVHIDVKGFENIIDNGTTIQWLYGIATYELAAGICHSSNILHEKISLKKQIGLTYNINAINSIATGYHWETTGSFSDTLELAGWWSSDFFKGSSLGMSAGIGLQPINKLKRFELGAYLNLQFKHVIPLDFRASFSNLSKKENETYVASYRDKPDYVVVYVKYHIPIIRKKSMLF